MLENLYTTKLSANRKVLQARFEKIRSKSGRTSKLAALVMSCVMAAAMLCATVVMAAWDSAGETITFYADGKVETLENKPFIMNNMTYLPLREIFEKTGVFGVKGNELVWDNGTIHIRMADSESTDPVFYTIKIGDDSLKVAHSEEDERVGLYLVPSEGEPVILQDGKTYVPYTFAEYMLCRNMTTASHKRAFDFMFTINGEKPGAVVAQGFSWPCGGEISSRYGERVNPATGEKIRHNGVDIAAPEGTEIVCAADGTVTDVGYDAEMGYYVAVEKDNIKLVYSHLMQAAPCAAGEQVSRGQVIGNVGNTGKSTGAHLHFEVMIDGKYYDPELVS